MKPPVLKLVLALLLYVVPLAGIAEVLKCRACGELIKTSFYRAQDMRTEERVAVCEVCEKIEERCFVCGLPVKTNSSSIKQLPDGRYLCARDVKDVVTEDETARRNCETAKDDLNRQFARFLTFPTANVTITAVDRIHLQSLFKTPGYDRVCSSIFGATISQPLPDKRHSHSINILSHLLPHRLEAVFAHELTHAWLAENLSAARRENISTDSVEGFCEFIAYKFMEARGDTIEQRIIKNSPYTRGQLDALLEAEQRYGLNTLIEWVKSGEDEKLDIANLSRIRAVNALAQKNRAGGPYIPAASVVAAPAAPDKLVLLGVSGAGNRRFALINNKTFQANDVAAVQVGSSNVVLRCLAIHDRDVSVQNEKTGEQSVLLLGDR